MHISGHKLSSTQLLTYAGLIDFLLSSEPEAKVLRDNIVFKIGISTVNNFHISHILISLFSHTPSPHAEPRWRVSWQLSVHYSSIHLVVYGVCVCVCRCVCVCVCVGVGVCVCVGVL